MPATVWRGRIAFGMVSIPVRLHKAARRERIRFHHVQRREQALAPQDDYEPVTTTDEEDSAPAIDPDGDVPETRDFGIHPVPKATDQPTDPIVRVHHTPSGHASAPILKGFELEKDRYVVLDPREIAELRPRTSTELTIQEFVLLQEIDPLFFDTSYYASPDRGGEKPYAILFESLRRSGYVALGSLAMHGREHAVVIRPAVRGLAVHTLFYANEVRANEEYAADAGVAGGKELELATMLIKALEAKFEPAKLKDTFEERLQELIDTRAHSGLASEGSMTEPAMAPVVDILDALRKSLAVARKPVKSETEEKKSAKTGGRRHAGAK